MIELDILERITKMVEHMGSLTPAAIFAMFCLYFAWTKNRLEKDLIERDKVWQKIRTDDAIAQARQSEDLQEIVITLQRIVEKVNENNIIISERLPRRP